LITRPSAGRPNGNQNRFLRVTKDHISSGGHHGVSKRNGVVACSPSHALDRRRAGMGLQEAAFPSFCCAPALQMSAQIICIKKSAQRMSKCTS
jgi:hypothetical protein